MSATRRAWRKEPAISAGLRVLLAGHGAPRHAAAQRSVVTQAAALEAATGVMVRAGFLVAEPSIAEAAAELGDGPLTVLPMFMADGYLVRNAVPKALQREARMLTPLGLMPRLADLIAVQAADACAAAVLSPARSTLLVVGHGSAHGTASRQAVAAQARRVAEMARFGAVEVAFLEEPPGLDEQCRRCRGDLVVTGFFAAPGAHASDDVPRLLDGDPWGDTRRLLYTGAIGTHPAIPALLAEILRTES